MGVLTDFVVVDPGDASLVGKSNCPCEEFGGLDAKGIDTVKLGTLYSILTATPFDPSFMGGKSLLWMGSNNGPWVQQVPQDFVERLAEMNTRKLNSVAAKWAKTEEFSPKYDNWPPEAVKQILQELALLCRRAIDEDKSVLMWMCL